jgi:uncharacterized protein (UPF0332 family)
MMSENIQALVTYRLEQADESLEAARTLLDKKLIRPSVNRAYYAMFYAVLALLARGKEETSKHSGAIALFDRNFLTSSTNTSAFFNVFSASSPET